MKYSIIILFLLLIPFGFSQEDFYLDIDGWCTNLPVPITVYNLSDWNDKEEILNDKDRNFSKLNFDITIYDGPFSFGEPFYEKEYKNKRFPTFNITFSEQKPYLIEIIPTKGNFSRFEEKLEIRTCKTSPKEKFNLTLETDSNITINLIDTDTTSVDNLSIEEKKNSDFNLDEEYNVYEITSGDNLTGAITVTLPLDSEKVNYSVYRIDPTTKELTLIEDTKVEDGMISFEISSFGIFSLFQGENLNSDNEIDVLTEEELAKSKLEKPKEDLEQSSSILDLATWTIIGLVIIIFLFLAPKIFGTKTQKESYHEDRENKSKQQITSSKEAYDKTKEYVIKYKLQYPRESIEKALKTRGVSDEIIHLVFSEEY